MGNREQGVGNKELGGFLIFLFLWLKYFVV